MAGIYLHIPFCKQKCHYCDFHFSTKLDGIGRMVQAICTEIELRKNFLDNEAIETIYFGGGTPSLLDGDSFKLILDRIRSNFVIVANVEITVECNPDDLSLAKLEELKANGTNRLSIGIQSFDDEILKRMNRAHNQDEALNCVRLAQAAGFENITVDLIYGVPNTNEEYWTNQINQYLELGVQHVSAYCLTIENNTVFGHLSKKGELKLPDDEISSDQFHYLVNRLKSNGYEQYEISNFAKPDFISKHNSAYWLNKKYLGIGPSAHSYNKVERGWNVRNNIRYMNSLEAKTLPYDTEQLTERDKFNDYILTRLRTIWGIELPTIEELSLMVDTKDFHAALQKHIEFGNLIQTKDRIVLSDQGKFIVDKIAADLFV